MAYAVIGGFTTVFSLISLFVKEKLYIGEATVATIFGVIVGPHCLNWFSPTTWGNTDNITLEISRIVLVVQIFAVAVELPKKYMLRHWFSVTMLLLPVMTFGWLISSVFIWKLVPTLRWVEALVLAACVTATDPVLASAVVGKGKFARRVPGHLRNLLSAESGCNDGMAFPFAYLALNCIVYAGHHGKIAFHFIVITVIYECLFGTILGAIIGYCGRHLIKFAEKKNLIDRESFLVFYFVLALFCTGVGSIIGVDDLLVAFAAGAAFSWDGWFSRKTEESHVSDVIDLLLNMSFFVYFGAIVPWEQFNNPEIGISAWKLVIIAILIILFRRLPIMLALKPIIPDIKTWREALFCGHFGPIGVGAIFISILSRAELEHEEPTPLAELPGKDNPHYYAIATIWPVTCFLIIASIIVHGSSIAVFTLGKRLNNLTITMTYTTAGSQNQGWLSRLSRVDSGSFSLRKVDTETTTSDYIQEKTFGEDENGNNSPEFPVIAASTRPDKPGIRSRRHHKKHKSSRRNGEGPPVAVALDLNKDRNPLTGPASGVEISSPIHENSDEVIRQIHISAPLQHDPEAGPEAVLPDPNEVAAAYQLGNTIVLEDRDGEVLHTVRSNISNRSRQSNLGPTDVPAKSAAAMSTVTPPPPAAQRRRPSASSPPPPAARRHSVARRSSVGHHESRKVTAYQLDDDIIVENEEGEIVRRYHIDYKGDEPSLGSSGVPMSHTESHHSKLASTLSHFGFRRRSTAIHTDLEHLGSASGPSGVPGGATSDAVKPRYPLDDERMRKHLKQLLISDPKVNPDAGGGRVSEDEYSSDSDGYSSSEGEDDVSPTTTKRAGPSGAPALAPQQKYGSTLTVPGSAAAGSRPVSAPSASQLLPNAGGAAAMGKSASSGLPRYVEEDEEEETEFEKARRLAALGLIKNDDDDDRR